jgi:DnaJ family protein C protein 3
VKIAAGNLQKANEAYKAKHYDEAIQLYSEVIQTMPRVASLRLQRAQCHLDKGEPDIAVGDLVRASQLDASLIDPLLNLANIHFFLLNERDKAVSFIRQCIHSDPEHRKCKALFRQSKKINKSLTELHKLKEEKKWKKLLKEFDGEDSLLTKVAEEVRKAFESKEYTSKLKHELWTMTCQAHVEVR